MAPYRPTTPVNYDRIQYLVRVVDRTILDRKVPRPEHISELLGDNAVKAFYFMYGLMQSLEYNYGRELIDYARRDRKAVQRHSLDSALRPIHRFEDRDLDLPSNYLLTSRENAGLLVHDLGEEFGQTLLGAFVVNQVIGYLMGEDAGKDADLLTNKNELLLDSLGNEINGLPSINHNSVYDILQRRGSQVKAGPRGIWQQYTRMLNALINFEGYVEQKVDYLPDQEKEKLLQIVNETSSCVSEMRGSELMTQVVAGAVARDYVIERHKHIMGIMEKGNYIKINPNLFLPGDPEFLLTLKDTVYQDYVKSITNAVMNNAISAFHNGYFHNGYRDDDSYLAPIMEKLADNTDTVANMEATPIPNATSIFRKAGILITSGVELGKYLRAQQIDYQRLQRGVDYLLRILDSVVGQHLETMQRSALRDTNYEPDLKIFSFMKDEIGDLERRVASMGEGSITEDIRDVV